MASKRALRRKACGRKQRYGSAEEALAALKSLTRAKGWLGYMAPYRCAFCHGFHFGHPPKKVRQAMGLAHG